MSAPIVVVGASLAGLRAVQELRELQHDGDLVLIGDEPGLPYDRPPLSKGFLTGTDTGVDLCTSAELADLAVDHRSGVRAISVDEDRQVVQLAGGETVAYSHLLVATGVTARRPHWYRDIAGVHTLRTREDASALRHDLTRHDEVLIIGGGFIGTEVAATARELGLHVTLLHPDLVPLSGPLGSEVAGLVQDLHTDRGVRVVSQCRVAEILGTEQCAGVRLDTGETIESPLVVVAVGSDPAVDWLRDTSVWSPRGIQAGSDGRAAQNIWAAGDVVAGHPGHWQTAVTQARAAARSIAEVPSRSRIPEVSYFWTDQYDLKLQLVGTVQPTDQFQLVAGTPSEGAYTGLYLNEETVTGMLAVNRPKDLAKGRVLLGKGADQSDFHRVLGPPTQVTG